MIFIYSVFAVGLLAASLFDVIQKRIPNWLSLLIAVAGLSWNIFSAEGLGLKNSGFGLAVGLLLMLPGYIFASMGAGDVKLMAAVGSVVGLDKVLNVVFYSYMVMFVLAIAYILIKGDFGRLLFRYRALVYGLFGGVFSYQEPDRTEAASNRMPLAPAIAIAAFYVLYPEFCNLELLVDLCHFQI